VQTARRCTTFHRGVLSRLPPSAGGRAAYAGTPGSSVTAEGRERPSQALYSFTDSRQALWGAVGSNLLGVSIRSFFDENLGQTHGKRHSELDRSEVSEEVFTAS